MFATVFFFVASSIRSPIVVLERIGALQQRATAAAAFTSLTQRRHGRRPASLLAVAIAASLVRYVASERARTRGRRSSVAAATLLLLPPPPLPSAAHVRQTKSNERAAYVQLAVATTSLAIFSCELFSAVSRTRRRLRVFNKTCFLFLQLKIFA